MIDVEYHRIEAKQERRRMHAHFLKRSGRVELYRMGNL